MSVPACIKLRETTDILIQLDSFWKNERILLQLDSKHSGKAANYFSNRKKILEKGMDEKQLLNNFEFIAYTDKRTENFFNVYLPQAVRAEEKDIFINKYNDTDALFRSNTIELFHKYYDSFCRAIPANDQIVLTGIVNRVEALANDTSILFQGSVVENRIITEFEPSQDKMHFVRVLFDRAYALANADTSNAVPLSFVLNQLTGKWLARLLKKTYNNLYKMINELPWDDVYTLSFDTDWQTFIRYLNAFIWVVQDSIKKNQVPIIESSINKLSRYTNFLSFWNTLKKESIDIVKKKMYEIGMMSEAQNFAIMLELSIDLYAGKYKVLLDVAKATDLLANRIFEKLKIEKGLSYTLNYGYQQKEKGFDVFR